MLKKTVMIAILGIAACCGVESAQAQQGYQPRYQPLPRHQMPAQPRPVQQVSMQMQQAPQQYAPPIAQGRTTGYGVGQPSDWQRFYHYPYVYYPHSFKKPEQYNNLYYRYPQSMQIPVYNKSWYNFYPTDKPYHDGAHFKLDIF